MSSTEAENISRYLRTKEIQLPSSNKWISDCINWYKTHLEVRNIYHTLQDYVCIQWLLSDLRDVQQRCLPTNCKDGVVELTGKYCVQVNWVRDVSQPCYTQLQAIKNNNIADSNEHVSAEEIKKQNWEPSPKRVLMMEVTDGFTTLKAMEHSPIPKLIEPFIPGFKVVLIGPIECRKGILFLKSNNISLLGGEVDYMGEIYSKENILSRCLNLIPPHNNSPREGIGSSVSNSPSSLQTGITNRVQAVISDSDQLPDSTSFIGSNRFEDDRGTMMDDDDDMLWQLPDTMFNNVNNFDPEPNHQSPVLGENQLEEVQSSTVENIPEAKPVFPNGARNVNRPRLFPSMEDLRLESESSSSNSKVYTLNSSERNADPQHEIPSTSKSPNLKIGPIKSSFVSPNGKASFEKYNEKSLNRFKGGQRPEELEPRSKNVQNFEDSIGDQIDNLLGETVNDIVYPLFKRARVKVVSITKLKIRNSEWNCCAVVTIEDKTENVTFCNKVLEKLFGTSATDVEVLRTEMAKNLSLKEKINDILKTGQTKLKLLNCLMTVEYPSEGCTPNIITIHEETI